MKYIKWLWENRFEMVMAVLAAVALFTGMIVSAVVCAKEDKEREDAVNAYLSQSVVVAEEPSVDEPIEETRKYFDVPLSHEVQDHIFTECEKHNIQPAIVVAMIQKESKFNTYALGDDGRSAGLMQVQAKWHLPKMIELECTDLFNPYQNITVGVDYLTELYNQYGGDYGKALTAYNSGHYSGTVTNYAKEIMNNAERIERSDV